MPTLFDPIRIGNIELKNRIIMAPMTRSRAIANPKIVTIGLQGSASSSQFDDDQNLFRLGSYFVLDATASRRISSRVDLLVAADNLFNQRYGIGKTPVTTIGPPILFHVGFRLHLGNR